jgi:hypothetical protein
MLQNNLKTIFFYYSNFNVTQLSKVHIFVCEAKGIIYIFLHFINLWSRCQSCDLSLRNVFTSHRSYDLYMPFVFHLMRISYSLKTCDHVYAVLSMPNVLNYAVIADIFNGFSNCL